MVVRTKQELDERISNGWGLTIKNGRWYVQKRISRGKIKAEIVAKNLDDYCRELYEEARGKTVKEIASEPMTDEAKAEKVEKDINKELTKKTKQSVVKHLAQALDKRTQYLIQWGLWVEANILPRADGDTWEAKAKNTLDLLNKIKDSVGQMLVLADENEKLKKENLMLRDMVKVLSERISVTNIIRDLLRQAILNQADPTIIETLINTLVTNNGKNKDLFGLVMNNG